MGEVSGESTGGRPRQLGELPLDRPAWMLTDAELSARLTHIFAAEQTLAAQRLALIAEIDRRGQCVREGATSTISWLRDKLRIGAGTAARMVHLARALAGPLAATGGALACAAVNTDQAAVVVRAITGLPPDLGAGIKADAEQVLLGFAAQFEPAHLAALGSRILDHVAPEIAEEHQRRQLERLEAQAWRERGLTMTPDGQGRVRLRGLLDTESAAIVTAAIAPLCAPATAKPASTEPASTEPTGIKPSDTKPSDTKPADDLPRSNVLGSDQRTAAQKRADALVEVCRLALATGQLPAHGGELPQVIVTMHLEPGNGGAAIGRLDDGEAVSPAAMRRMACDASIIPAVLGGGGQFLDVGRARRLFTGPVRKALMVRDGGCCFPGCDRPLRWTEGHHIKHWLDGGRDQRG